ncbi:phytoene desaturase family protein [Aquimarina intermedia]|uniref:All-trans-retinol 13,14-reductase n=1 Tax=Aquimarina intermedia TaxID=350814 RepID=A0A5S5BXK3_9FLAO|nr:NAD(P)/FAD-dependent oxidoreductase [Aquimarina intermedia]TYP70870.1 all-trans-retinol 13,14-reductase [Aquimarina intermedia]
MTEKYFKKFTPDISFDKDTYIIVGSGIGGLTTAVFLAKAGKKVVILEQHYTPGGFTHTFKRRDGFEWDVGVHYVGNMGEKSKLRGIFNYLSNNRLEWDAMGDPYDVAYIGDKRYEYVAGIENFRNKFYEYFPEDKDAIDTYLKKLKSSTLKSFLFFVQKALPTPLRTIIGPVLRSFHATIAKRTTYEVLRSFTDNMELIAALTAQCGNYGLPPKQSSFAAHAIVVNHFMEGGYYPRGGADAIPQTIVQHLKELNTEVFIKARVDHIITEKNKVSGISINGRVYACNNVISNAGAHNTFQKLLKGKHAVSLKSGNTKLHRSTAHFCLYIGLNKSDKELELPKYNIWWHKSHDLDENLEKHSLKENELPFAYISFPSSKDSAWSKKHPNTSTIQIIGKTEFENFEEFEDTEWMHRGDRYATLKKDFEIAALKILLQLYPHLEDAIAYTEVSSPLSTKKFSGYQEGEIYGVTHAPERFTQRELTPRTKIKGLYLTGQDITLVGVGGAMSSGILTAITIIKWNMSRQFKEITSKFTKS